MKIVIDLTSLADNFSGIERYAACLAREMIKNEKNEYILLFKKEVHPFFKEKHPHVKRVILPDCHKLLFNQYRLPHEIRKHKADWYLFLAFPVPVFLFQKNMVSTIHDICCWDCPETMNGMSKWYFQISHKIALRKCRNIITISKFSEDRIKQKLHVPHSRIWRIYCGVDEKFLQYRPGNYDLTQIKTKYQLPEQYLLSLSTLEPRKNIRLLVEAYTELTLSGQIDIPLVLAGRKGWKMDALLTDIDEKAADRIYFTGFIDDEDLPAVYGCAKLFVFPSMYEGFGIPPLEAMACGARVLSSDAASLPEVLGDSAVYFASQDKVDLKKQLLRMLEKSETDGRDGGNVHERSVRPFLFQWGAEGKKLMGRMEQ